MDGRRKLVMRMSLDVLRHLGLNLYSNVPAVLSEAVANAWDADAASVEVELSKENDQIVIKDDGVGMTRDQVIDRFLLVGYQRRIDQPGLTSKGRTPMGRKGIGGSCHYSPSHVISLWKQFIKGIELLFVCAWMQLRTQ